MLGQFVFDLNSFYARFEELADQTSKWSPNARKRTTLASLSGGP